MCTCTSDVAENGSSIVAHGGGVYNWHHHNCAFYISIAFEHHHGLLFSLLALKRCTHLTFAQKECTLKWTLPSLQNKRDVIFARHHRNALQSSHFHWFNATRCLGNAAIKCIGHPPAHRGPSRPTAGPSPRPRGESPLASLDDAPIGLALTIQVATSVTRHPGHDGGGDWALSPRGVCKSTICAETAGNPGADVRGESVATSRVRRRCCRF